MTTGIVCALFVDDVLMRWCRLQVVLGEDQSGELGGPDEDRILAEESFHDLDDLRVMGQRVERLEGDDLSICLIEVGFRSLAGGVVARFDRPGAGRLWFVFMSIRPSRRGEGMTGRSPAPSELTIHLVSADDLDLPELLRPAIGPAFDDRIDRIRREYAEIPTQWLLGAWRDGRLVGCVGVDLDTRPTRIQQIAVQPDLQRRGVAVQLLRVLVDRPDVHELIAETDEDAVLFYLKAGFDVHPLGRNRYGVRRYECRWNPQHSPKDGIGSTRA